MGGLIVLSAEPLHIRPDEGTRHALAPTGITPETAARCRVLLASLPRQDQRLRGEDYVRGLLTAQGRKSMRNVARTVGGPATEQRLHHFISESTWNWRQVRAALAQHLESALRPDAWVVLPMDIVKEGEQTVGVRRRFVHSLGRYANSQLAYGLWLDSQGPSCPAHWHLSLPDDAREGVARVRKAERLLPGMTGKPERTGYAQVHGAGGQALHTVLDFARWGSAPRPVVMTPEAAQVSACVAGLRANRLPFLLRVNGDTRLLALPSPSRTAGPWTARALAEAAARHRRRMTWTDPANPIAPPVAALATRVRLPEPAEDRPLVLLAEWQQDSRRPTAFWLSDLDETQMATLLSLSRAPLRAADSFARTGVHVGLGDFTGRSLSGWHRHISLASIAHALAALDCAPARQHPSWSVPDAS